MSTAVIDDVDLYYETHGDGVPLLLVAGLASDSQSWQPILPDLSSNCRVVTFDNRGAGRTTPHETKISIQRIADDCIGLAGHLGITSFNLLGHSMGGFAALDCAIRYPGRVNRLILAATSSCNSKRNNNLLSDWASCFDSGMDPKMWFRNIFYWIFSARFFDNEEAVTEAIRFALEYPYPQSRNAFRNQIKAIADFNCTEELSRITSRTMVIGGKEDLFFPPEVCAKLAQAIPGAVFSLIDNAAHSLHMDNPQAFTDSVLDFLFRR
ncbi:MAG: alpha/beta hydrolase [Nitrospirae bacterium]|nr:alpha/beta hydrolase [Nitrospirota bacterium]